MTESPQVPTQADFEKERLKTTRVQTPKPTEIHKSSKLEVPDEIAENKQVVKPPRAPRPVRRTEDADKRRDA